MPDIPDFWLGVIVGSIFDLLLVWWAVSASAKRRKGKQK